MDLRIFDKIDELANLNLGKRNSNQLYKAARGSIPLSLETAKFILNSIENDGHIMITSGFPVLPEGDPETDGPPGAIALAKGLNEIGANPKLVLDEINLKIHLNLMEKLEIENTEIWEVPLDPNRGREFCKSLLENRRPELLTSIEKPGRNQNGVYYDMRGNKISSSVGRIDNLFLEAEKKGIPTIGIGDGGNEIGMGNISQTVKENIALGEKIASRIEVDQLFVSTVSNWGAYGILSALSILEETHLIHDGNLERELIEKCVDSGARDGVTKDSHRSIDGIPCYIHEKVADMFHYLVERELQN